MTNEILTSEPYYIYYKWLLLSLILLFVVACSPDTNIQKPLSQDEKVLSKAMAILANPEVTDKKAAFAEFKKACELGSNYGCHKVGIVYNNGLYGKAKDYQQAKLWYEKAGNKGYIPSRLNIANLYAHRLLPLDDETGYYWLVLAQEGIRTCLPGSIEAESATPDSERRRLCELAKSNHRKLLSIFRKRMSGEEIMRVEDRVYPKRSQ
jgi:TPR repeat protein